MNSSHQKTIRIFISSTFRDMQSERDFLVKYIFPELRERCKKKGLRLIDVDLRWGVTEQEAEQGKALEVCLDEIETCRPFFIGILGERYGWTPDEYTVPDYPRYDWLRTFEKGHSITALEIYHGVLNNLEMRPRAFFYFRNPAFASDIPLTKRGDVEAESNESEGKLKRLKELIIDYYNVNKLQGHYCENYSCNYKGIKVTRAHINPDNSGLTNLDISFLGTLAGSDIIIDNDKYQQLTEKQQSFVNTWGVVYLDGLEPFGKRILEDLWLVIENDYSDIKVETNPIEIEKQYHESILESLTYQFTGREDILKSISEYVSSENENKPLFISGEPGSGKSALLAMAGLLNRKNKPGTNTIIRFCGTSPMSVDIMKLIEGIIPELCTTINLSHDLTRMGSMEKLPKYLNEILLKVAKKGKHVLILIDAINQLNKDFSPNLLSWLPKKLPTNIKIIISTQEGQYTESAIRFDLPVLVIRKLEKNNCITLVQKKLSEYRKKLSENQIQKLLSKDEAGNPLFLSVACEELRVFPSFEQITNRIESLPHTIPLLFEQVLMRLEQDHGAHLVRDALCLLQCSIYGLTEEELLRLLKRDGEDKLPQNIWARLFS